MYHPYIIDAYSSTTKKNASPSMHIGGLYIGGLGDVAGHQGEAMQIGGLGEGRSPHFFLFLFLGHLSP